MCKPEAELDDLRREIDEIDIALHDLIMRRTEVVQRIADTKGRRAGSAMRPGREAKILRCLTARHRGSFPRGALVRIWREIISSLTAMQGPFSIAVYSDGSEKGYWDMARDHFGSHTDIAPYATRREVLAQVSEGKATHGVLPFPTAHDEPPWWAPLFAPDAPRIVMRLPFAELGNARGEAPQALIIARIMPEATGDDRTLLIVETKGRTGRTAMDEILANGRLTARTIATHGKDLNLHLVEAQGFLGERDVGVQHLGARDQVENVMIVGAYPVPLPLPGAVAGERREA